MSRLSKREKIMLFIMAVFLMAVGMYYLFVIPGLERIEAAQDNLSALQNEKLARVTSIQDAQVYATVFEENLREIEAAKRDFMAPMSSEALEHMITEAAMRHALTPSFVSVDMNPENKTGNAPTSVIPDPFTGEMGMEDAAQFQHYSAQATVYGRYEDFLRLLDEYNNKRGVVVTSYICNKTFSEIYFGWRHGLISEDEIDPNFFQEEAWQNATVTFSIDVYVFEEEKPQEAIIGPVLEGL